MIAFRMILRQPNIFVHIEGDDILEGQALLLVKLDKVFVNWDRGGSGR
jgi:hypothetical protein